MPDRDPQTAPENSTDVYAIHGAEPGGAGVCDGKVFAVGADAAGVAGKEISAQKAEQFLNTFYFQYGHRSIADLAHLPMAVERLSDAGGDCAGG